MVQKDYKDQKLLRHLITEVRRLVWVGRYVWLKTTSVVKEGDLNGEMKRDSKSQKKTSTSVIQIIDRKVVNEMTWDLSKPEPSESHG